jgi:hypothetical protein
MKLVYIDESGTFNDSLTTAELATNRRKSSHFVLSAAIVDIENWKLVFDRLKNLRGDLRRNFGISKSDQIHAHELVGNSGVWRHEKYKHLTSSKRRKVLRYLLENYKQWPEISVISTSVEKLSRFPKSINPETAREVAYQNLFNRIEKNLGDELYVVIVDGQEDFAVIKTHRKMKVFNMIGKTNIPLRSSIEDPLFKLSKASYFLQMIDHIAYATLHVFDARLNQHIARDLVDSRFYEYRGIKAAHSPTADLLPGVVIVPSITKSELAGILKKSLGESPDSSGGAGATR